MKVRIIKVTFNGRTEYYPQYKNILFLWNNFVMGLSDYEESFNTFEGAEEFLRTYRDKEYKKQEYRDKEYKKQEVWRGKI